MVEKIEMTVSDDGTITPGDLYKRWITAQGPAMLHEIALNWNYSQTVLGLVPIVSHPDCDRATALNVYIRSAPDGEAHCNPDPSDFDNWSTGALSVVADGFARGRYTEGRFDPGFPPEEILRWKAYRDNRLAAGKTPSWYLPDRAFDPLGYEAHDPPFGFDGDAMIVRDAPHKGDRTFLESLKKPWARVRREANRLH